MGVWLRRAMAVGLVGLLSGCVTQPPSPRMPSTVDGVAERYVQLALELNRLDPGTLIDNQAPTALRTQAADSTTKLLDVSRQAQRAIMALNALPADDQPQRRKVLINQLAALTGRASMLRGWKPDFDDEVRALYDVQPVIEDDAALEKIRQQLDALLPPITGASLAQRYADFLQRYAVTGRQLEAAFRTAISTARRRSAEHLKLPADEQVTLEATPEDADWELREHYLGGGHSSLQINSTRSITLGRVIELAARETYPGRHVGDSLRQQELYRGRGWIEFSVLPRYSAQAFIAEGRARVAAEVVFPQAARLALERELFHRAGFDVRQVATYDRVWALGRRLQPEIYQAARALSDGTRDADQTGTWLQDHALLTPAQATVWVARMQQQRSAAVVHILAGEVVRRWLQAADTDKWRSDLLLLEMPQTPYGLQKQSEHFDGAGVRQPLHPTP